jgi:hypothetical protein
MEFVKADRTVGEPGLGWTLYAPTVRLFRPRLAKYKEAKKRHQIEPR